MDDSVFIVNENGRVRIGEDGKQLFVSVFLPLCLEQVRAAFMMDGQYLAQQFVHCYEVSWLCFANYVTHFYASR